MIPQSTKIIPITVSAIEENAILATTLTMIFLQWSDFDNDGNNKLEKVKGKTYRNFLKFINQGVVGNKISYSKALINSKNITTYQSG